jgi:hypothetical protein
MKYIKCFEHYNPLVEDGVEMVSRMRSAEDLNPALLQAYVSWNFEEHPDHPMEDAESVCDSIIEIMDGIKRMGDYATLYRVVMLDDISMLDRTNVGNHYVLRPSDITEEMLFSVDMTWHGKTVYILTCKVPKECIDYTATIDANIAYPLEREITVQAGTRVEVLGVELYHG